LLSGGADWSEILGVVVNLVTKRQAAQRNQMETSRKDGALVPM
jgi:hypothetical protein